MRITAQQTEWMIGGDQSPSGEIDWDGGNLNLSPFKGAVSGWANFPDKDVRCQKAVDAILPELHRVDRFLAAQEDTCTALFQDALRVHQQSSKRARPDLPPLIRFTELAGRIQSFVVTNYVSLVRFCRMVTGEDQDEALLRSLLDAIVKSMRMTHYHSFVTHSCLVNLGVLKSVLTDRLGISLNTKGRNLHLSEFKSRIFDVQVCKTCAELTSFPVVLPCKHHFCWDCLVDVSPTLSSCPVCERAMIMLPEGACVEKVDGLHLPFEVEADKALLEMGSIPNSPPVSSSFPALMSARNSCFPALVPKGALSCAKGCIGALCQSPPSPEKSSSARLLLIGVDGCRPDCLRKVQTPHIDELIREGAYSLKVAGDETGRTLPGWYSVLSGTCSKKHRIMDDDVPDDGPTDAMQRYPIFTSRLQTVRPKVKSQFFTTLEGMHGLLDLHGIPCIQSDDDDKQAERLEKTLRKADCPEILVGIFEEVDVTGHHYGFSPYCEDYLDAIRKFDAQVGRIMAAVKDRKQFGEDWLVVLCTTHGGIDRETLTEDEEGQLEDLEAEGATPHYDGFLGVHLLAKPENTTGFMILHGASVKRGELLPAPGLCDVGTVVFAHFDVPVAEEWDLDGKAANIGAIVISKQKSPKSNDKYLSYAAAVRAPLVPDSPPSPSSEEEAVSPVDDFRATLYGKRGKRLRKGGFKRHYCRGGPTLPTIMEDVILVAF